MTETTPAPVSSEQPVEATAEPTYPVEEDDDGATMVMYEYVGCYVDTQEDRVLDDKLDAPGMTTEVSIVELSSRGFSIFGPA